MAKTTRHGLHAVSNGPLVAIAGAESLLGRELRELIGAKALPVKLKLISLGEETDATSEDADPTLMTALTSEALSSAKVVILAGALNPQTLELFRAPRGAHVVDVLGKFEDQPDVRLRAPLAEAAPPDKATIQVIAHPAAIALAMLLKRIHAASPIDRAVLEIFQPASELGQRGIEELQQQTIGLLSFQKLKKDLFDAQLSFNMLPQYGSEAPHPLSSSELTIERHLATLLSRGGHVPMPSLRLIQAPVFHGYSFSIWIAFEKNPGVEYLSSQLASAQIDVRGADVESPTNAGAASQSGIAIGNIAVDRNNPQACWFWAVTDNIRMAADNAVEVLSELL